MSTTIYEAWRTTKSIDTFKLVELIRGAIVPKIEFAIKQQVANWQKMPHEDFIKFSTETCGYVPYVLGPDAKNGLAGKISPICYSSALQSLYKKQANDPHRNTWDLDLSFTFRKSGNRHYILPYYGCFYNLIERGMVKSTLDKLSELEDYAYWNNTDEPEGMLRRKWSARKNVWNKFIKNWDSNYLTLEIMTPNTFMALDPIWKEAWARNNP